MPVPTLRLSPLPRLRLRAGDGARLATGRLLPLGPVGGQRSATALAGIALLFAAGWGEGLYAAVAYLSGNAHPHRQDWLQAGDSIVASVSSGALLVWAALLFARRRGVTARALGLGAPATARGWWELVVTVGVYVLVTVAGFDAGDVLADLLGAPALVYPQVASTAGSVSSLVDSLLAGPTEEIVLLGVVVTLLRRAGWSWWPLIVLDVVIRVSFHAYYGWGCLGLALWAAALAVIYARTGRLLALVVGHSVWDVTQDLQDLTGRYDLATGLFLAASALAVAGLATGVFGSGTGRYLGGVSRASVATGRAPDPAPAPRRGFPRPRPGRQR